MKRRRLVRAPASSANLGPGYDVLAAALSLNLELEVEETGEFFVHSDVPGVPTDRSNLCVQAFERLHSADGVTFQIRSEIPAAAGLGSSAAAIVAGLTAADHMYELDAALFELAVELEGHPDNVAAALHGGFVICPGPGEEPVRFDPPPGLEAVVAIPDHEVPTAEARAAMPAEVPLPEAVHNVGHAALLVLGLAKDDFSLIGRGLRDHRAPAPPPLALPALDGAAGARGGARRGGSDDLRRGPHRAVLVPLAADRRPGRAPEDGGARLRGPPRDLLARRRRRARALSRR